MNELKWIACRHHLLFSDNNSFSPPVHVCSVFHQAPSARNLWVSTCLAAAVVVVIVSLKNSLEQPDIAQHHHRRQQLETSIESTLTHQSEQCRGNGKKKSAEWRSSTGLRYQRVKLCAWEVATQRITMEKKTDSNGNFRRIVGKKRVLCFVAVCWAESCVCWVIVVECARNS